MVLVRKLFLSLLTTFFGSSSKNKNVLNSSQQMQFALFEYGKSGLPQGDVERYPVAKLPPVLPVPDISDEPG